MVGQETAPHHPTPKAYVLNCWSCLQCLCPHSVLVSLNMMIEHGLKGQPGIAHCLKNHHYMFHGCSFFVCCCYLDLDCLLLFCLVKLYIFPFEIRYKWQLNFCLIWFPGKEYNYWHWYEWVFQVNNLKLKRQGHKWIHHNSIDKKVKNR